MDRFDFGTRCGFRVPRVNIGAMRFPQDIDEAVTLIRHAIDSGMVYIDTSRGYGDSEIKLGKALKNGYRQKVILSTKWSPWVARRTRACSTATPTPIASWSKTPSLPSACRALKTTPSPTSRGVKNNG